MAIPNSILNMINDATKKAYIITALGYIKEECNKHPDNEYNEDDEPITCLKCPFCTDRYEGCFFKSSFNDAKIPEEWDLDLLEKKLKGE